MILDTLMLKLFSENFFNPLTPCRSIGNLKSIINFYLTYITFAIFKRKIIQQVKTGRLKFEYFCFVLIEADTYLTAVGNRVSEYI